MAAGRWYRGLALTVSPPHAAELASDPEKRTELDGYAYWSGRRPCACTPSPPSHSPVTSRMEDCVNGLWTDAEMTVDAEPDDASSEPIAKALRCAAGIRTDTRGRGGDDGGDGGSSTGIHWEHSQVAA